MPRTALVSVEDAVTVIEYFFEHFEEGRYPDWSSNIWKQMSNSSNNQWSGENFYNNVTKNRRGIMEMACANKNVPFIPFKSKNNKSIMDESSINDSARQNSNDSVYEYDEETAGLDYFEVRITIDEWKKMREPDVVYNDQRNYPILHRNVWTDVLALAVDRQMELPCAFNFDKSKIYETPGSRHYMRITGSCKSKQCGNKLFCYLDEEPGNHDFNVIIRTRDTFRDTHEKVERPLRGLRRQQVGEQVFNEGCANWRKQQIVINTRFGGRLPSSIPDLNILRQAKKEYLDRKLHIKPSDGKDILKTIEDMKDSAAFHGFIHEIRRNKFYVAFSTPAQLHAYKQYCRTVKEFTSVSINGTGSLIKPLIRDDGSPSGHIFLYSVTINFNGTTLSVYDMLTESQDTDVIWWWLKQWHKIGAPKPKQAVCDSSRALMNGISLALNYQTVKTYIETCFLYATENPEYTHRSPIYTYLRLDIAHLMIMVRKWKCFEHMRHTVVRQFYQYCIGLMIDCQTLNHFKEILQLTFIVGVNEFQDSIIAKTGHSVLNARKKLEEYIANRNFDVNFEDSLNCESEYTEEETTEEENETSRIRQWIANLRKSAEDERSTGTEPNSFYFVDFIDRFMTLAYEFPLWTAVAIPYVAEHARTAFVEGHFKMIKHGMLKNFTGLMRVDKFLKFIFQDYSGSAAIITSKLKVSNQNDGPGINPQQKQTVFSRQDTGFIPGKSQIESHKNLRKFETSAIADAPMSSLNVASHSGWCDTGISGIDIVSNNNNGFANNIGDGVLELEHDKEKRFEDNSQIPLVTKPREITIMTIPDTDYLRNKGCSNNQLTVHTGTAKAKYFKPNPNIQHRNNLASNIRKPWLLQNGNLITKPARIDGLYYFAYNTCGFDSIVQLLSGSVMDDPAYMNFVQKSDNATLQFVLTFVKNGPCAATYKERIMHLKNLFKSNISANYDECRQLASYSIDIYDNLNTIWMRCFNSEPSAYYTYGCSTCNEYTSSISTLTVNHKIIGELGFSGLLKALDYHRKQYVSCINENCTQLCQVKLTFNTQIFIELDIRPNINYLTGMTGSLRDFPENLNLDGHQYRLSGVVARLPGHYIAYCRRINNCWELCNDTKTKIINCPPNTIIEPHGCIYIALTDNAKIAEDSSPSFDTPEPNSSYTIEPSTPQNLHEEQMPRLNSETIVEDSSPSFDTLGPNCMPMSCLMKTSTPSNSNAIVKSENNWRVISSPICYSRLKSSETVPPLDDSDTTSRDNWRNKEVVDNIYFETSLDEIEENSISDVQNLESIRSDISNECEQMLMLRTGNIMPGITIDGEIFHLQDTHNFDSIVHILLCSALDDSMYMAFIEGSLNETLKFVLCFIDIRACPNIYSKRAVLLKSLYSSKIFKEEKNNVVLYTIDLREAPSITWETCLGNEPSIFNVYDCKFCGTYTQLQPTVTVDANLIVRKGFTALNEALHFYKDLKKVKCQQEHCLELCTVAAYPNSHIYIQLDVRNNDRSQTRVRCKLQNFPTSLRLKGLSEQYRLKGIISEFSGRFVAHCLRVDNRWEFYDGYSTKTHNSDSSEVIEPCGAIYIWT